MSAGYGSSRWFSLTQVPKPMQYSVPGTSLSIVFGMATTLTPSLYSRVRIAERIVTTDWNEAVDSEGVEVLQNLRRNVVDLVCILVPEMRWGRWPGADGWAWSGSCGERCHRFVPRDWTWSSLRGGDVARIV